MATDTRASAVTITELDPTDASAVDDAYNVIRAAVTHDLPDFPSPCRHQFVIGLSVPWPGEDPTRFVARDGTEIVGFIEISLPTLDNLDNAWAEATVHPDNRRRGLGRALYQHAVAFARDKGRRRLMSFTPTALIDAPPREFAGTAFATAMGMTNALDDVRRRLDVSTVDQAACDALLAEAWPKADGYSIVRWTSRIPDEYVDDVALLDSRLVLDAPMGDLAWEQEKIDGARLRANEDVRHKLGTRTASTAARHDATGRVVALSALIQDHDNHDHAWQGITIVHPAHRGHRLGTIVKVANLRYAIEQWPRLRYIDTWNAAVNDYMIVINERMGFRRMEAWANWQQDI